MVSLEDLKSMLEYHDDLYYNQDSPELSDEEYDNLKSQYLRRVLLGEDKIPGEASDKFAKVKHLAGIKSLDKINTDAEVLKALDTFEEGDVTIKLDGLTIVVYGKGTLYKDKAVWATRGSGTEGEDVSHTCAKVPGLKAIDDIVYRCEVYMLKSEFERINKRRIAKGLEPFKNPRNAAAGMIRNLDADKVEGLRYLAYRIIDSPLKHTEQLKLLKSHGIQVVPHVEYNSINKDKAFKFITTYDTTYRNQLPMEIDGLVIQSDMPDSIKYYGETGHHPKDAFAYKFSSQGAWTTLTDVIWQVGRLGTVSPVAVFDSVDILGSTISRATLHNISYIKSLDLKIGSSIYVIKANDVIPRVSKVEKPKGLSEEIAEPRICPVCYSDLTKVNDMLYCTSVSCPSKLVAQIAHMAKKEALNIEGLSTKTIEKIFDAGLLNNIYDIFSLYRTDLKNKVGFTENGADKLVNTITSSLNNVPFDKFLYATCVPLLGRTASKEIAKVYDNINNLYDAIDFRNFDTLKSIPGIGDEICESLFTNRKMIKFLSNYCNITYNARSTITSGNSYNFVITGALNYGTRDQYEATLTAKGHTLQRSVAKSTDFLVTNDQERTTKRIKAEQLGTKIITEYELLELLKK